MAMVQTVATAPKGGKTAGAGAGAGAAAQLMGRARVLEVTVAQAPGLTIAQAPRAMVTTMMMLPAVVPQQEASHLERCPSLSVVLRDAMGRFYRQLFLLPYIKDMIAASFSCLKRGLILHALS